MKTDLKPLAVDLLSWKPSFVVTSRIKFSVHSLKPISDETYWAESSVVNSRSSKDWWYLNSQNIVINQISTSFLSLSEHQTIQFQDLNQAIGPKSTEVCVLHHNLCTTKAKTTGKARICSCTHQKMIKEQEKQQKLERSVPSHPCSDQTIPCSPSCESHFDPEHSCSKGKMQCKPSCDSHNEKHLCTGNKAACSPSCVSHSDPKHSCSKGNIQCEQSCVSHNEMHPCTENQVPCSPSCESHLNPTHSCSKGRMQCKPSCDSHNEKHTCTENQVACSPSCITHLGHAPSQASQKSAYPHVCTENLCTPSCETHIEVQHDCTEEKVPCSPSCDSHAENYQETTARQAKQNHACSEQTVPCTPSCDSHVFNNPGQHECSTKNNCSPSCTSHNAPHKCTEQGIGCTDSCTTHASKLF